MSLRSSTRQRADCCESARSGDLAHGHAPHARREVRHDRLRRPIVPPRNTSASAAAELMSDSELMDYYGWQDAAMPRHYTAQVRASLANKAHQRASPLANLLRADNAKGRRPIS